MEYVSRTIILLPKAEWTYLILTAQPLRERSILPIDVLLFWEVGNQKHGMLLDSLLHIQESKPISVENRVLVRVSIQTLGMIESRQHKP